MAYLNKNIALTQLQELLKQNINSNIEYLPKEFVVEQQRAYELFEKRILLEKIIDETITFNKSLVWTLEDKNLKLVRTAEELIDVFKLRSDVYHDINYQYEFPDPIEGLNFNLFDTHSAVIYFKTNDVFTGTIRLIFDNGYLPSEEKFSFNYMREKYDLISEISRQTIRNKGLGLDFKYLMKGIYEVVTKNNVDIALSGIKEEHYKLFSKFGGVEIEQEMDGYGSLDIPFLIISYNPRFPSRFFKKAILGNKSS